MWITYHILYYAGKEYPKVYKWMLKSEFFAKLKYQIMQKEGKCHLGSNMYSCTRLQPLAVSIMYEMCRTQPLTTRDLNLADEDFLHYLLDLVEQTRGDMDEGLNYGTIELLLAFNEQFMLYQANVRSASNYTPSNLLLSVLADRPGASSTFGENLIFMLNRAEEATLQTQILKLLFLFFTSPKTHLNEFFYTNDLYVLVDVMIRELWNLPEEQEDLRNVYLRVLGPLLKNTQLRQERATYKRAELIRVLGQLGGNDLDESLRSYIWEQERLEQQGYEQMHSQGRKLTFRDRQSSNLPLHRQLPTPLSSSSSSSTSLVSSPSPQLSSRTIDGCSDRRPSLASGSSDTEGSVILEKGFQSQRSRSNSNTSNSRTVSRTTQRLVERVLRDWLVAELGQKHAVAEDPRVHIPLAQ
ncbi:hypothetical protein B0O80DRAFT_180673 [Mortierella sp. GBAus27b]|nr:hypothetical protein B0O80DRAFT_180673 [Mortierella sp. GBAus27b]